MSESLGPQERIRKKKDFLCLYTKGRRHRGRYFIFIYISNGLSFSRMAVVVSKKFGSAVKRNRIKRQLRALFRKNKQLIKIPADIIIIPKRETHEISWPLLKEDYTSAIQSISRNIQNA